MTDFNIEKIVPLCSEFGITLDDDKIKKLNLYGNLLLEWNEKINLTAITNPEDVLYKHFYDCILFFKKTQAPIYKQDGTESVEEIEKNIFKIDIKEYTNVINILNDIPYEIKNFSEENTFKPYFHLVNKQ